MSLLAPAVIDAPINEMAEWSVLGHMMHDPTCIGEVIGTPLEQSDFSGFDTRLIFQAIAEMYFSNRTPDPLVVADSNREALAGQWNCQPAFVGQVLEQRSRDAMITGNVREHADLVRKASVNRGLMDVCYKTLAAISEGALSPEEIGDHLSTAALNTTAGSVKRAELRDWMDVGREYARHLQLLMKARQEGTEIGVYTGLPFIDDYTVGIAPGELCFLGGDPGVGKTAVAWAAGIGFARRQLAKPPEKRVSALMLSMEMNLTASTMRVVQSLTSIDGVRLREGALSQNEYQRVLREWKNNEELPLLWNFASNFRLSQMRALVSEAIRKHNVGFVIIDHFSMLDTDRRYQAGNEADDAKVRFLKENLAKDLNVAVICLAHTRKAREQGSGRPRMGDLRGSGMIAAFADQIGLLWAPSKVMSEEAKIEMDVLPEDTDVELEWVKNRFGNPSTAHLTFYGNTMRVVPRDPYL